MKRMKKWLCLGLIAALLLPAFASCDTKEPAQKEPAEELVIAADGTSEYVLIYPADATKADLEMYNEFSQKLREITWYFFEMKPDSEPAAEGAKEILLGKTNRPASAEAYNRLGKDQFGVFVIDGQVALVSDFKDGFEYAADKFIERCAGEAGTKLLKASADLSVIVQCEMGWGSEPFSNLHDIGGDDPWVIEHEGSYYYCWSSGGVKVAKIDGLDNIVKDNGKQVFSSGGTYHNVWAPELHYIDGAWYIYVAMCAGSTENAAHRMYVLKGTTQDPTDPFRLVGQVTDSTNKWAIDGTVFKYKDELYTVWSGWPSDRDGQQNLYIAHMSDPCTIDSERVLISSPSKPYELVTTGPSVNEGPTVLVRDDRVIVTYSGNGSWTDDYLITAVYCDTGDLLNQADWVKLDKPLLTKGNQTYGPGHCSFSTAPDGSLWVIYHANIQSGSGWEGRSVRIQPVEWKDNLPYIGKAKTTVDFPAWELIPGKEIT
ncbi:MAG: glycoside hydrolase family 43 protein [Clostridia bacterium]|nr:glycoside hydrolase family 43 protein [Clostridia bacterium]